MIRPTPDTITFSLAASLNAPLGLSVEIDAFNLSLFNRQVKPMTPFITVPLGKTHLKGNSELTVTNQTTHILDETQFVDFLANAVYSKTFTLSAYGKTTAHLGKLKIPLKLDKDVELDGKSSKPTFASFIYLRVSLLTLFTGLDKLSGFSIDSASVSLPPKADGSNLIGTATLPNHSVVTFALVRALEPCTCVNPNLLVH